MKGAIFIETTLYSVLCLPHPCMLKSSNQRPDDSGGTMPKKKVAMLTAGGLAPCLSSAVGGLIERYTDVAPKSN
jgi:hypothetical protein